jgi:hypothetical protein
VTALDDALESSSVVFHQPDLTAIWEELPPNLTTTDPLPIHVLTPQMSGQYEVTHSLDDGMPDAVTMTNGNDASGAMKAGMVGRQSLIADVVGWRTSVRSGSGVSAIQIPFTMPTDAQDGDQLFFAISWETGFAWGAPEPFLHDPLWEVVNTTVDSGGIRTDLYTRKHWTGGGTGEVIYLEPQFVNTSYTWICAAAYARTANNMRVPFRIGTPAAIAESANLNLHTAPPATLPSRGYLLSVWSTVPAAGSWAIATGVTELAELGGAGTAPRMMMGISPLRQSGVYTEAVNTGFATTIATMQVIPVIIGDLPDMPPDSYFSPFNKLSPIYGFDRDTAAVEHKINVLTESGIIGTRIFKGMMEDIGLAGKAVEMSAVSKTRIDMDRSLVLPVVHGYREGCTVDWLVTWLMSRGGQFAGPQPSPYARYWAPLYGSVHAHLTPLLGYNSVVGFNASLPVGSFYGIKDPATVEGPFLTGMFAQQTATQTDEVRLYAHSLYTQTEILPFLGTPEEVPIYDQFSQACSQGRVVFWLRGDPAASAPAYLDTADDFLFRYNLYLQDSTGKYLGYVMVKVLSASRHLWVQMGSDDGGAGSVTFSTFLTPLETDGNWHFYGISWDYSAGEVRVNRDGMTSFSTYWATNGFNYTFDVPETDAVGRSIGDFVSNYCRSHLPIADFQIESGFATHYLDGWTRHYPIPNGSNALMRATNQPLKAIAEPAPVRSWEVIASLAQATTSAYRVNEDDNFEFLPQGYFGEISQMTPAFIADTELNASEIAVAVDASKSRNVVTVQFPETNVDINPAPVLSVSSAVKLVHGEYDMTFVLDIEAAEIHGAATPPPLVGSNLVIRPLLASELANPATIPTNIHYMTPNSNAEGTGWGPPYIGLGISARIVSYTASTVTVRFKNIFTDSAGTPGSGTIYLANNVDQLPHLRILGYGIKINDGYVTQRDAGSISVRRERAMDTEMPWVQDRFTASARASALVSSLARPRSEVKVVVMGDPRRRPGQLVQLMDAEGTQAEGTWRILAVDHTGDNAQYTQLLSMTSQGPIALWDDPDTGWDVGVWGE